MDTTPRIDANSLLNLGVDPNLHPLLASTSILPGVASNVQTQLYAPVDSLLVGYITPIVAGTAFNTERASGSILPNSFGTGVENAWVISGSTRNNLFALDAAPLDALFPIQPLPALKLAAAKASAQIAQGKALAVSQIQDFLNRPDRFEQFKIAFGQDLERATIERVIGDWQTEGNKIPNIEIVSSQTLGKADGGFDTANNKIYLSSNLIERGNSAEIVPVIIEEIGHYLDSKIHPGGDAAGDEGEIFAKLVRGVNISDAEYVTLINEDDHATILLNNNSVTIEQAVTTNYAIKAEKTVSLNGSSDLDGNPLDLSDDALVYGGQGFTLNGNTILPVKYDTSGNPIKDSSGKLVLVDKALSVSTGYGQTNVNGGTKNKYAIFDSNNKPQIVPTEIVTVPLFADLKQQELNRKIPTGTPTTTFNISTNPINTAAQWATKFPPAGTTTQPTVVRVTGGGLNVPGTVNLNNYVIIVDSGDINFNGTGNLSNVTLVTSNGNINLNSIQSDNLSALASGTINHNSSARFGGNSLFANGTGNITFNGATKGITSNDNLWVISAGGITFNGAQSTRGSFVSTGDFISNGSTDIYGTVSSKQNVIFNGALNFTYTNIRNYNDSNPPVILANLVNDSGTSNSDKITNDSRISGTVTDASQIVEFKAGFDSKPLANYTDVLPYLTNGSFSFTKAQLETIYGGTIPDGSHTLNLVATDQYGNQSSVYPYSFTLDTTTPVPTLNLAATSDTGVAGDYRTKSALVTLTGKVEANARVLLSGNPTPVTADSSGNYTFANVALTAGNNSFTVTATDLAGNQKAYTQSIYRTSPPTGVSLSTPKVLENSANNTQVGVLSSIDPDGVDNYAYTLVNDAGGRFKLVGDKIQVANGSLLDFETNTQHQIQVRTTDGEGDSYLQNIAISVLNVNEFPTSLLVSPTVVIENSPTNTLVGTITTTDPDAGDSFSYSLVVGTGDGDNGKFAIAGDKLVIKNSPDFENQSSYTIRLKTTDAGGLTFEKQVTVSVTNINEAPTSLTLSNNTVAENSGVNGIIGTFTSIDPDLGDTKTYALTTGVGDLDNSQFTIVGDKLQLNPNPNFEAKSSYQLRVKVTDGGGLSYQQAFNVNISDVNEAPTNLAIDKSIIDENSPANSVVGNLITTDPDLVDTASYTLVAGTGDTDNSKFALSGNKLQIKQSPDFETQSSYSLRIRTTDKSGLSLDKVLTVSVNNLNEAPTSLSLSNNTIAENIGINGIIGTFISTDPDVGDTKTYTLMSGVGDTDNSQFTIVGDKLQLKPNPDFETKSVYKLRAKVTDAGGLSYEQAFTVNISDVNEAPTNLAIDKSNIDENSAANSVIGNLTTTDPDSSDTASYTLVAGTGDVDNSKFAIAGNKLQVKQSPDFETQPSYSIRIRTTDKGGLTYEKQLTVGVNNLNEAPTSLALSNNTVAENSGLNGVIGTFTSTDPDLGDTKTYALTSGLGDSDNNQFTIVSDKLQLNPNPNFEAKSSYQLRIKVTDGGGLSYQQAFTVNISDVNEAPTNLNIDKSNIDENSVANSTIGNLTTTDPDLIDTASYTLVAGTGDVDNNKFAIAGNKLQIKQSPDFETQSSYSIRIRTTDKGGLTYDKQLTIGVNDLPETNSNTLVEGTSFNKRLAIPVTVPTTGGKLSFKLNPLQFDGTDLKGIKDALEVALVDAVGKSVVTTFQTGRDAFFNWTEGETVVAGKGVSFDSTTGIVTLDLTGVKPGQTNLVFHLINDDKDTTTNVTITDVILSPLAPLPLTLAPLLSATATTPNPVAPTFFNSATDVSASIGAAYHRTSFNEGNKELDVNVALKNQGSYGLNGTLVAIVNHLSDPSVQVKNADGFTPEGLAYYRFTTINGKLDPTQLTSERTLVFRNPNGVQFSYDLTVLSDINAAPVIKSQPELEVIGGKKYQYQVKAEDLNGDSLTYKLLSAPSGMAIDPSTGLVSWNTSVGQIGNDRITVEVSDGRGGVAQQDYNLAVITPPPNRPPVFTSTPVVDAAIGSVYSYQGIAKDPDGDSLIYSLTSAPTGMSVDANTGVLTWKPTGSQLGTFDVSLGVSDGQGGNAQQQFKIRTGAAVGNHAPIITSTPITEFGILSTTNGASTTNLQTIIRDFRMWGTTNGHPDFERFLGSVDGMVSSTLGSDGTPVFIKPDGYGATSAATFAQWYHDVPDVNQRVDVPLTLVETVPGSGIWEYQNYNFFPIDNQGYGNQGINHNFAFTVETHNRFTYKGGEVFNFTGDDDVWVFINNKLVVDLGGTHPPRSASVNLDTLGLTKNQQYSFDLFSAERHTDGSNLRLQTSIDFGAKYLYQVKADDVDKNPLKYELIQAPTGMQIDANGLISWQPKLSQQNTYPIIVKVTDDFGGVANQSFDLKVVPSNPGEIHGTVYRDANGNAIKNTDEAGIQGRTVYIDENLDGQRNLDEVSATTDANGNYVLTNLPSGAYKIAIENQSGWNTTGGTGAIILANGQILNNLNIGQLEARDPSLNHNPYFVSTPPNSQVAADNIFKYQVKAQDPDGDGLTYSLVNSSFSGIDIDPNTGLIAWQPRQAQIGSTFDSLIQVKDAYGGIAQQTVQFKVVAPNSAPVFTNVPLNPIAATVNSPFAYQFRTIDPDNDPVTYRIVNPAIALGATIDAQTGVFKWTTAAQTLGLYSFTLGATDGKTTETLQNFTLDLQNTSNLAPVISSTPRKQTPIGQTYIYQIAATDPNSDPLTYSLINPPAGMSVNDKGLLSWTPTAAQLGQSAVKIQVSDGRGGITTQDFGLEVVNFGNLVNHVPEITSTPTFTTNIDKTYSYQLTGTDSDNDTLIWSLDNAPKGMVIDASTGILKWNPTSLQLGTHTVAVRLTDAYGLYVGQEYTLKVNGVNTPPQIQSSPNTVGGLNSPYKYQVKAIDAEGDALKYTLGRSPQGMVVQGDTGLITWTPNSTQIGTQTIDVLVTDAQGAASTQTYNLVVGTTPINQPPTIISTPKFTADINGKYQDQVVGIDPENSQITYSLTTAPSGMIIDASSGLITWNNPTLGTTQIAITATDAGGAVAVQGYALTGNQNHAPVINSTPTTQVTIGNTYRYDVVATDAENDALTYSLDNASLAAGVTIDKLGRITWKPTTTNLGIKPVTVTVTDINGAAVAQTYNLEVLADNTAPVINLVRGTNIADIGETISFQVQATDNVGIKSTQLLINNQAVALDSNGVGTYKVTTAGVVTATAVVTDLNGNTSTKNTTVNVIDPTDIEAPTINLDLSGIVNGIITGRTDIKGTVTDTNLDYYTLEVARFGTDNFKEVFRGNNSVANGTLGKFDPSLLENDTYRVRLTAYDTSGHISSIEDEIEVTGDLKLGNFRLSFTDLTIPVTGIPITLSRTYDSLTANDSEDFGYGWRMEFRDTDLRTSLKADPTYQQLDYRTVGFNFGTQIYITLPGGKREGFTFSPLQVQGAIGGVTGGRLYYPNFVADKGVTSTLTVPGAEYKDNTATNQFATGSSGNPNGILLEKDGKLFNLNGRPYVPQDDGFGNRYLLTSKDGTQYEINASNGKLESVTDTNGNTLTYSETEIKSSTGVKVTFERDNQGRIVSVTDPLGQKVVYGYDAKGDLVSVKDRDGNTTKFEYDAVRSHYLDKIIDPLNREAVKTEYDENGRLKKTANSSGNGVEFVYNPANSLETVKDALGNATTFEYDIRGNVVTEVDAVGKVTKSTYDDDNRMLSETVITEESGAAGYTTTYTYDSKGNELSRTNPLGQASYYTYNASGKLLTSIDPLGHITSYTYDGRGNVLSKTDANNHTTTYAYDGNGNVLTIDDGVGHIKTYTYDRFGNRISEIDALRHTTTYTYDGNGHQLTETKQVTTPTGVRMLTTTTTYTADGKVKTLIDAENGLTRYEYDANGNQTSIVDAQERRTENIYDNNSRLTQVILPDNTPNTLDDNQRIKYGYDALGNRTSATNAQGQTTFYTYDVLKSPTGLIRPDSTPNELSDNTQVIVQYDRLGRMKTLIENGVKTEFSFDAAGRIIHTRQQKDGQIEETTITHDAAGRKIATTDAQNHTTRYVYDNLDRLTETIFTDGSSMKTVYDAFGNIISKTDRAGHMTSYEYDGLKHLTAVIDPEQHRTEYVYDELGDLVTQKDANENITRYEYDGLGRRTAIIRPLSQRSETVYNKVGNVVKTTDFNGHQITYEYDEQNRVIAKHFLNEGHTTTYQYALSGQLASTTDDRGTTSYQYNEQGQLLLQTNPDLTTIAYTYDSKTAKVATITTPSGKTTYQYNALGQLAAVLATEGLTTYQYDALGNLQQKTMPNGVTETSQYNNLNQVTSLETKDGAGTIIARYVYTYDAVGNRKTVQELSGRKVEYSYDDLNRLTEEKVTDSVGGNRVTDYAYDKVGNRLMKIDSSAGETDCVYDNNDRLISEKTGGVTTTYTYDNNGNIKSKVTGSELTIYVWNDDNKLSGVTVTSGGTTHQTSYRYDAKGNRVSQIVDGVETRYLVDENRSYAQVLEDYSSTGTVQTRYVYGRDLELISQSRSGATAYYSQDSHSGVRLLTNALGSVTDTYTYDVYGLLVNSTGITPNSYLYRGEQTDTNSGLQYLRARYYDPSSGRFASTDPFEGVKDSPISRHRYVYANGNPITGSDPSGRETLTELLAGLSALDYLAISAVGIGAVGTIATFVNNIKSTTEWEGTLAKYAVGFGVGPLLGFDIDFGPGLLGAILTLTSTSSSLHGRWLIAGADYGLGYFASMVTEQVRVVSRSYFGIPSTNNLQGVFGEYGAGVTFPELDSPLLEGDSAFAIFGLSGFAGGKAFAGAGFAVSAGFSGALSIDVTPWGI